MMRGEVKSKGLEESKADLEELGRRCSFGLVDLEALLEEGHGRGGGR